MNQFKKFFKPQHMHTPGSLFEAESYEIDCYPANISLFTEILSDCTNSSPFTSKKAQISSAPFLKTTLCLYGRRETCISSIHSNFNLYTSQQNLNRYHWTWSFSFFPGKMLRKIIFIKVWPIHEHFKAVYRHLLYSPALIKWY